MSPYIIRMQFIFIHKSDVQSQNAVKQFANALTTIVLLNMQNFWNMGSHVTHLTAMEQELVWFFTILFANPGLGV